MLSKIRSATEKGDKYFWIIGVIFLVNFESYFIDYGSEFDYFMFDRVPAETLICTDIECVEKILEDKGLKHLKSIFKITYDTETCESSIKEIGITKRVTIDAD